MNRFKSLAFGAAGFLILALTMALMNTSHTAAQPQRPSEPVTVVNTAADWAAPVPTTISGAVQVGNTTDNPVVVREAESTGLAFQTPTGGVNLTGAFTEISTVDVSRYKQVRVLIIVESGAGSKVQLQIVEGSLAGLLDTFVAPRDLSAGSPSVNSSISKTYDIPGKTLKIVAQALPNPDGTPGSSTIDVVVYGR